MHPRARGPEWGAAQNPTDPREGGATTGTGNRHADRVTTLKEDEDGEDPPTPPALARAAMTRAATGRPLASTPRLSTTGVNAGDQG